MTRLCAQTCPRALRATDDMAGFIELLLDGTRMSLLPATFQIGNDPFKRVLAHKSIAFFIKVEKGDLLSAGTVYKNIFEVLGQIFIRCVQIKLIMLCQAVY